MMSIRLFTLVAFLLSQATSLQAPKPVKSPTRLASTMAQAPPISIQDQAIGIPVYPPPVPIANPNVRNLEPAIWKLALAGSLATIFSDMAVHPVDCIKTLQQSDEGIGLSMLGAAQVIYTQLGGLEGFYRGFLTYVGCDAVGGAIKFSTYELLKRQAQQNIPSGNLFSATLFACAAMSFVTSSVITVPGELLKLNLQMGHYSGCFDAVSSIWQTQGISGFYQGYDGVFLRDVPYTAMELGLYDLFKTLYMSRKQPKEDDATSSDNLATTEQILLAGLTGGIIGFLTTPLDTIKTKLMVDAHYAGSSFLTAFVATIHDHGWESVFCGASARVVWLIPLTAIYLPTYDFVTRQFSSEEKV
jgi:solute carrier family 25 S-adenosylmethionine transporter 26